MSDQVLNLRLSQPLDINVALDAHAWAMRKGMTWRHAVRDALFAAEAAYEGRSWCCRICLARYDPGISGC